MRPLIAGNWKMNGVSVSLTEIEAIAADVAASAPPADILICPPATLVERAVRQAAGRVAIGGQNCHEKISGAYTGDISAEMLKDAGASAVILGHSERRQYHGETDDIVSAKTRAAWRAGLFAIVCIGESENERQQDRALHICGGQVAAAVPDGATAANTAIAYEPVWAIGTGKSATCEDIGEMHAHIRQCLVKKFGDAGKGIRILYGGSMKPANAREILETPEVGGGLIGGASLKAQDFRAIYSVLSAKG